MSVSVMMSDERNIDDVCVRKEEKKSWKKKMQKPSHKPLHKP